MSPALDPRRSALPGARVPLNIAGTRRCEHDHPPPRKTVRMNRRGDRLHSAQEQDRERPGEKRGKQRVASPVGDTSGPVSSTG